MNSTIQIEQMPADTGENNSPELTRIIASDRPFRDIAAQAVTELIAHNSPPVIFKQQGRLVRIAHIQDSAPKIESVTRHILRHRLARVADYVRMTKRGPTDVAPPLDLVNDMLADRGLNLPSLNGIVRVPTLRPDGSILDVAGYDQSTGLYYIETPGLTVPPVSTNPGEAEIGRALEVIDNALGEFPFDCTASRTNHLALVLTLTMREVLTGLTPLWLVDKPKPGTGATLLCDTTSRIARGQPLETTSPASSDSEWRKRITAALDAGKDFIVIDNLETKLSSAALAAAITSRVWSDRRLGHTALVTVPQRAVFVVTGNNIQLAADLVRRSICVRLDAKVDRPWLRSGFRHNNLPAWVDAQRGELLWSLLTICRSWFAAGQPAYTGTVLGGFEQWTAIIGGILEHAGLPQFLGNQNSLYADTDADSDNWCAFLEQWHGVFADQPVAIKTLVTQAAAYEGLQAALVALFGKLDLTAMSTAQKIGLLLRSKRDAVFGQYRLERGPDDLHAKVACWRVTRLAEAGTALTGSSVEGTS